MNYAKILKGAPIGNHNAAKVHDTATTHSSDAYEKTNAAKIASNKETHLAAAEAHKMAANSHMVSAAAHTDKTLKKYAITKARDHQSVADLHTRVSEIKPRN